MKAISLQSCVFYSQSLFQMRYASLIAFFVKSGTKKMPLPDTCPFEKLFAAVLCYCSIDLKTLRFFNLTWKFSACNSSQNCPLKWKKNHTHVINSKNQILPSLNKIKNNEMCETLPISIALRKDFSTRAILLQNVNVIWEQAPPPSHLNSWLPLNVL